MQLSSYGLNFIKQWEGLRLNRYLDSGGNPTIGYGHLIKAGENLVTITEQQASDLLFQDVQEAVNAVNSLVRLPLSQSMFDALVSLVFNWGAGNFSSSTHLEFLNSGDYQRAATRIAQHPITSGGKFVQGLLNRRIAESQLFLSQGLPDPSVPVPMPPLVKAHKQRPAAKKREPRQT